MPTLIGGDFGGTSQVTMDSSSFGGPGALSLLHGDRYAELERRMSYYDCTQHDLKFWDFNGRPINPLTRKPMISAERCYWIPIEQRRPSSPVRLGKVIVASFTNLLYGENRFPSIRVEGDADTEDWIQTCTRVGKLPATMLLARAYGGAAGTTGLSWYFREGKPQFEAHKPQNLFVHSWANRRALVPEHVSEVYLTKKQKWDGKGFNSVLYWFRRDWTPNADVAFLEVPFEKGKEPVFIVDDVNTVQHGDDCCHLEWIQNLPSDEIDGLPDYDGLYENFDTIDLVMSTITRGGIRNLDPTVKLKMDADQIGRMGISKGSDNALIVGKDGDADYMEMGGGSIDAGLKLVQEQRRQILETAQCILPDPNEVAAQGISSVAIKAMFAPMTAKADQLRETYGSAKERVLDKMQRSTRTKLAMNLVVTRPAPTVAPPAPALPLDPLEELLAPKPAPPPLADPLADLLAAPPAALPPVVPMDDPLAPADVEPTAVIEEPAQFVVDLPPKMIEVPLVDPLTGKPDGTTTSQAIPRKLGPGGEVTLQWPPYFLPTPTDQSAIITALTTATGGKAVLSVETAVESAARAYGADPAEEWRRVQAQAQADASAQASMLDAPGGPVGAEHQPPAGASPRPAPHEDPVPPHPKAGEDPVPPHPGLVDPDAHVPVDLDLTKKKS